MAAKKASPAFNYVVSRLKRNPGASYADIRAGAEAKGLQIYPIVFGRAQALLGIVKSAPRGQGKQRRAKRRAMGQVKRGPGRPPKRAASGDSLGQLIDGLKDAQRDHTRLRAALERVRDILDTVV